MMALWNHMKQACRKLFHEQRGQAMTEYIVTVGAMIALVFALSTDRLPFFPALVRVFQIYLDSMHTVVTLPIP